MKKYRNFKKFLVVAGIILIFIIGFFTGRLSYLNQQNFTLDSFIYFLTNNHQEVNATLYNEVWQKIQDNYINRPVDNTKAFYGSIAGLVESLGDPYSVFMDPESTTQFQEEITGEFEGIGAEIGIKNSQLVIVAPLDNSPASIAGLKAGDKILKINDASTAEMNLDYAISQMRGKKGTTVKLSILRDSSDGIFDVNIIRDKIKVKSVDWEFKPIDDNSKVSYLKITNFNEDTDQQLNQAISSMMVESFKGLIIDLRNNTGGYLTAAIDVTSEFIDNDVALIEVTRDNQEKIKTSGTPRLRGLKTVILVNQGTASASEIVAGALKDYGLVSIVGTQTFGKGSVQTYEQLSDGSSLKLTVAKWLTPQGHSIDEQGITPDYVVELSQDDYNNGRDPQMDKAIELIKS